MTWTSTHPELVRSWGLRGTYQERAINAAIANARGIIVSPAGSGKTIIAARAVEAFLFEVAASVKGTGKLRERRLLWIANTTEQVAQAKAALKLIPAQSGVVMFARIECATPALLARLSSPESIPYDYLVIDECHHAAADVWAKCIETACAEAKRVLGFTATDHREDGEWAKVEQLIGPVISRIEVSEVESGGHRTSAVVRIVTGATAKGEIEDAVNAEVFGKREDGPPMVERAWAKMKWQLKNKGVDAAILRKQVEARCIQQYAMKLGVSEHAARISAAARIAALQVAQGHSVLLLVYSVEQGRAIAAQVPGARLVFSKMKVREDGRRADIIAGFCDGSIPCLVATSLADEGFDAPRASVLVLAAGGRGISKAEDAEGKRRVSGRLVQRTGRVQRKFDGKEFGTVYDFEDAHHRFLEAQAKSRVKGYKAMGFDVSKVSVAVATGVLLDDSKPTLFDRRPVAVHP